MLSKYLLNECTESKDPGGDSSPKEQLCKAVVAKRARHVGFSLGAWRGWRSHAGDQSRSVSLDLHTDLALEARGGADGF